jgi:hypothetical protein
MTPLPLPLVQLAAQHPSRQASRHQVGGGVGRATDPAAATAAGLQNGSGRLTHSTPAHLIP